MSVVTGIFRSRWASGDHIGAAKPEMRCYLRRGRFRRGYQPWDGEDMNHVIIPGESPAKPWQATWQGRAHPPQGGNEEVLDPEATFEDWIELPSVLSAELEQGFDENGLNRATLTVENISLEEKPAVSPMSGVFHAVQRGGLAPFRGYAPPGQVPEALRNRWYQLLFRNAEVRIDQGYGLDQLVTTFKGAIDDLDLSSAPDRIVISARDFGQVLVDGLIFGWNTSKQLGDPVIFADQHKALETKPVGGGAKASSERAGYRAAAVLDESQQTAWYSETRSGSDLTEWIEVRVPKGRYTHIRLACASNMEAYIGIKAAGVSSRDFDPIPEGFYGAATVPGATNGGWKYAKKVGATRLGQHKISLGATWDLDSDSVIRVGFRNLPLTDTAGHNALVTDLHALRVQATAEAKKRKWVVTRDVSDVVRVILRWAGFKEWAIEDTGIALPDNLIVNRANFYIDAIRKCCDLTGYEFFMGDPTGPSSLGMPTFRQNSSLRPRNAPGLDGRPKPLRTIRDRDLLTGMSVKLTDEPLRYIIRVRGAKAPADEGGRLLSGDKGVRRKMFVFRPPWTLDNRQGGFIKHAFHYNHFLRTVDACEIAAYLIGLAMALKSATAVAQIPGNPEFELDDQVRLVDEGTGLATRMWIAQRSSTFTTGTDAEWTMSLGGSLIDTPDIVDMKQLIHDARARGKQVPQVVASSPQQTTVSAA